MRLKIAAFVSMTIIALTSTVPVWAARPQATAPPQGQSLYKRLGGYDALAAVTDDFIARLAPVGRTAALTTAELALPGH